eukprot:CAMPEP_0198684598 /NCGR_PEP_ID=MMETSP1468-20131203/12444_1 /TAXON_ID=1461545 /ORGANISM="Mantoniella sp, Strain CCMP1436" /LENGTH=38 /DNA_ID= /DNA_START= /DNA_END= /DNA_ORIENTATION=
MHTRTWPSSSPSSPTPSTEISSRDESTSSMDGRLADDS